MVFYSECLEINPEEAGYISNSCTQHQGWKMYCICGVEKIILCAENKGFMIQPVRLNGLKIKIYRL